MKEIKTMTPRQVQRYSRHIIMPDVGSVGQRKLLGSSVLIVGAGGLGSPIAIYLAVAGVGTIGIVDFDTVELSNLQRQILHQEKDIGRPKVESAKETLLAYNPDLNVILHEETIPRSEEHTSELQSRRNLVCRHLLEKKNWEIG